MALLSDRESFDNLSLLRAEAAIDSETSAFTIIEACERTRYPYPVSENDLRGFVRMIRTWGIKTNMDDDFDRMFPKEV